MYASTLRQSRTKGELSRNRLTAKNECQPTATKFPEIRTEESRSFTYPSVLLYISRSRIYLR